MAEISPQVVCLHPGEQTAAEIGNRVVEFVGRAQRTLGVVVDRSQNET